MLVPTPQKNQLKAICQKPDINTALIPVQELFFLQILPLAQYALWKFDAKDSGTGQDTALAFSKKGQYPVKLTAVSASGCIDTITQVINIASSRHEINIPNVFTPNGDAFNNTFVVSGLNPCDTYNLWIYNRWGQLYYHSSSSNGFSWDGVYHGIKVPGGVYYYVLHGSKEGQLTGTITVIY